GIRDFHVTGVQTCALPISYDPSVVLHRDRIVEDNDTKSQYTSACQGRRSRFIACSSSRIAGVVVNPLEWSELVSRLHRLMIKPPGVDFCAELQTSVLWLEGSSR